MCTSVEWVPRSFKVVSFCSVLLITLRSHYNIITELSSQLPASDHQDNLNSRKGKGWKLNSIPTHSGLLLPELIPWSAAVANFFYNTDMNINYLLLNGYGIALNRKVPLLSESASYIWCLNRPHLNFMNKMNSLLLVKSCGSHVSRKHLVSIPQPTCSRKSSPPHIGVALKQSITNIPTNETKFWWNNVSQMVCRLAVCASKAKPFSCFILDDDLIIHKLHNGVVRFFTGFAFWARLGHFWSPPRRVFFNRPKITSYVFNLSAECTQYVCAVLLRVISVTTALYHPRFTAIGPKLQTGSLMALCRMCSMFVFMWFIPRHEQQRT